MAERASTKAVRDRERPLRDDLRRAVPRRHTLRLTRRPSRRASSRAARRRFRRHNAGRRFVESEVCARARRQRARDDRSTPDEVRDAAAPRRPRCAPRSSGCGRCSRRRSCSTTCSARRRCSRLAAGGVARRATSIDALLPTALRATSTTCAWTAADVAAARRGPRRCSARGPAAAARSTTADEIRTYGHIVVDEVQDLTPMQLRMLTRRSLNGSMTVVGDIAQATGALAPDDWDDVLDHLPDRRPARGHRADRRLPHPGPDHGARRPGAGGRHARPAPPRRCAGRRRRADRRSCRPATWPPPSSTAHGRAGRRARRRQRGGRRPRRARRRRVRRRSTPPASSTAGPPRTGPRHARSRSCRSAWSRASSSTASSWSSRRASSSEEAQGLRALYVALTRATQRLTVVHAAELPPARRADR